MRYPSITKNDTSYATLISLNLATEEKYKVIICKSCGFPSNVEDLRISNDFWDCSCGKSNKYNLKHEKTKSRFIIKYTNYIQQILKKLAEANHNVSKDYDDFFIITPKGRVPLIFLEFSSSSSLLETIGTNSIVIYYSDRLKSKLENTIIKSNFLSFSEFFGKSKEQIKQLVNTLIINFSEPKISQIKKDILSFAEINKWRLFEEETQKLFDSFRTKTNELNGMLDFFKKNKNIPLGLKFVHVAGNYEVDILPIQLFEYFNQLIDFEKSKGIDAKCYSNDITEKVYNDKVSTNRGRGVIFVTNQFKVSPKVWEKIIKSKEQNNGWCDFIVDLDIMSILVHFLGLQDLYQLS